MQLNRHEILISALENEGGYYNIRIDSNLEISNMEYMLKGKWFKRAKRADPHYDRFKITPKGMKIAKEAKSIFDAIKKQGGVLNDKGNL